MSTGETWTLGHRPALDGLRGIAVLLVVVCHVGIIDLSAAGAAGVTMFFTLSGFLITALLLRERDRNGAIDLRAFYTRRARRLFPALFFMLAVVGGSMAALGYGWLWFAREAGPVVLYFGNWSRMGGDFLGVWSHTWSLAVEEQFYLLWPIVFPFLRTRRAFLSVAAVGLVYGLVVRAVLWDGGAGLDRVYYALDTRADALLVGCALAAWMHGRREPITWPVAAVVLVLGIVALGGTGLTGAGLVVPGVVPLLTAATIYVVACGDGPRWLRSRPLVLVGQRSYGLYLWHYPILALFAPLVPGPAVVDAVVLVPLSWVATVVSWRYVEAPFMRARLADCGSAPVRRLDRPGADDTAPAREGEAVVAALHHSQWSTPPGRRVVHNDLQLVDRDRVVAGDRVSADAVPVDEDPAACSESGAYLRERRKERIKVRLGERQN